MRSRLLHSLKSAIVVAMLLSTVAPLLAVQPVRADTASDVFFDQLRRKEQRDEEQRRKEAPPNVRLQPELAPAEDYKLPREEPCFTINTIRLDGDPQQNFPWLRPLVDGYRGQCIGVEGINVVLKRLQRELLARGFITTRVYVPKQDLTTATLTLLVMPGIVRQFRFADDKGRGSWVTAFPSGPGDLLNLRDLEQGVEQMKRLPTQDVDMDIVPGAAPGESDIVIKRKPEKPWRAVLGADNSGSDATGRWQGSATVAWDDPFGINDLLNLSLNSADRNSMGRAARGNSGYYSFPFGYWTFALSASEYRYHQTVSGINQNFITSGEVHQQDVRVTRLLTRSAASKTSLQCRLIKRKSANFIEDVEIETQRRDTTAAEAALQHRQYVGRATVDIAWAYRHGVAWWGAEDEPDNRPAGSPTTRYALHTVDMNLTLPFSMLGATTRYLATIRGQTTRDTLYGADFFAIGNRYTVRGFDGNQTLAAERGVYIRNELGVALGQSEQELYVGLDSGRVGGPSAGGLSGRSLTGTVLGLRGRYNKDLQYDLSAGWALKKPENFQTDRPAYAFQLNYQF